MSMVVAVQGEVLAGATFRVADLMDETEDGGGCLSTLDKMEQCRLAVAAVHETRCAEAVAVAEEEAGLDAEAQLEARLLAVLRSAREQVEAAATPTAGPNSEAQRLQETLSRHAIESGMLTAVQQERCVGGGHSAHFMTWI